MADIAVSQSKRATRVAGAAGGARSRLTAFDRTFATLTRLAAILVLVLLGAVMVSLVSGSWLAFSTFGLGFLFTSAWNPVTDQYGALPPPSPARW